MNDNHEDWEKDCRAAEDNWEKFAECVRRIKANLDKTPKTSPLYKILEKALQNLANKGPSLFDELIEKYGK